MKPTGDHRGGTGPEGRELRKLAGKKRREQQYLPRLEPKFTSEIGKPLVSKTGSNGAPATRYNGGPSWKPSKSSTPGRYGAAVSSAAKSKARPPSTQPTMKLKAVKAVKRPK